MAQKEEKRNIYVTEPFLPQLDEYLEYIAKIWSSRTLTNDGSMLKLFEQSIQEYFGVSDFHFVANGTLALQLALSGSGITEGEIITTPFSYVATTSAILWQNCTPVYVDIDPETLCLDPANIEAAITDRTKAILPVHVFGNPCDVFAIDKIARRHNLTVIYDAAHAFGVWHQGQSLASYGDVSTLSFHATKLFHTIEGGGVICKDAETAKAIDLQKQFGHINDEHFMVGVNAKANEFQAAMGLANLKYIETILESRKHIYQLYAELLAEGDTFYRQRIVADSYNYSYVPLIFKNEELRRYVADVLHENGIFPRRYFYPSLNELSYLQSHQVCPISEEVSRRILCLPTYHGLTEESISNICDLILSVQ